MEDERVDRLLRALPRQTASVGFTARVLARLDEIVAAEAGRSARFYGLPRLTLPAAVLAATVAVAASLSLQDGGVMPLTSARRPGTSRILAQASRPVVPTLPAARTVQASSQASRSLADRRTMALMQEIRAEHGRLHEELRRLSEVPTSTVYLGGDDDADLVVHLDQVRPLPPDYQQFD